MVSKPISTNDGNSHNPKYRPDIDGLRAVAVLLVVGFHAFPFRIKGGFIGVDIFFVISGFLISTIIFSSLEANSFRFGEFYSRRVRRIFPALLLVLISIFVLGWFVLLPDEFKQLGKHITGGAGFISNIILWNESGYFDNVADTKPLLHLWSLGIEEQFYIFWPALLWAAWRKRFNLLTITVLVAAASFVFNLKAVHSDPVGAFYSPQSRFWEMLVGSYLAWISLYSGERMSAVIDRIDVWLTKVIYANTSIHNGTTVRNVQSFIGITLIASAVFLTSKERSFPGWWALLPTVGTAMVIAAGSKAWLNRIVLSNSLLVWIGLISFPLYLWHWPLLSVLRIVEGEFSPRYFRISAVLISIILAWLTYRLVERPFRFGTHGKMKTGALAALMVLSCSLGYYTYQKNGLGFRVKDVEKISKAVGEWGYPGSLESFKLKERVFYQQRSENENLTLFLGDSNIEQYYVRIDELNKTIPKNVNGALFLTGGGCLPLRGAPHDREHEHCVGVPEAALGLAASKKNITTVVIGALWNAYLGDGKFLIGKYGYGSESYNEAILSLSAYIKELIRMGKKVFVMLNIPAGRELDPKYMVQRGFKYYPRFFQIRSGGVSLDMLKQKYGPIQNDLAHLARESGAVVINPLDYLCDSHFCQSVDVNGEPIYKDLDHLRPSFVRKNADFVDQTVVFN